jgi:phage baseplate assembly protein W
MPSYSWPLLPDAPQPQPPTPAEQAAADAAANAAKGLPSFLGAGLLRPFRRDEKNDLANGDGIDVVAAALGQILGTRADSASGPGELPWRTDFGSRLHLVRHRNMNDATNDLVTVMVQEAVARWEPRIRVVRAAIEKTTNPRLLQVRIRFTVVDRSGRTILQDQATTVSLPLAA